MPALSFSGITMRGPFWVLILLHEKTQTCRRPRKRPIKKGDNLILYWKQRVPRHLKVIHKIGETVCTQVETLRYADFAFDEAFARADGFYSSLELQEWFGSPLEYADEEYDVIHWDVPIPIVNAEAWRRVQDKEWLKKVMKNLKRHPENMKRASHNPRLQRVLMQEFCELMKVF